MERKRDKLRVVAGLYRGTWQVLRIPQHDHVPGTEPSLAYIARSDGGHGARSPRGVYTVFAYKHAAAAAAGVYRTRGAAIRAVVEAVRKAEGRK